MATEVKMPQLGLTMEEGTVAKWLKAEGDTICKGDILLEITTDKLTSSVESEVDGILLKIVAQEGEDIPVKGTLAYIGTAGESVDIGDNKVNSVKKEPEKNIENVSIAIIGGGPGGYVAAIRAAQLGAKVTLIEKNKLGGTCLNVGCIPTKTILHAAEAYSSFDDMLDYGISVEGKHLDWNKVQEKKKNITEKLVSGIVGLMRANKVEVVEGHASFDTKDTLIIKRNDGTQEVRGFDKIIIASGSIPSVPSIPGINENENCVDSTGALEFESVPKSLLVIGGGVIGMELANAYAKFGTEVTVVEAMPKLLPMMDGQLTKQLQKILEAKGIKILTGAQVQSVEKSNIGAKINVTKDNEKLSFEAEKVLVAVGRRTNTEGLNLDKIGIKHDRGRIDVNENMETSVPGIYAIGDCLGKVMLAHVASEQGEIAVENALGGNVAYDGKTNPSCVYTDPEFAGVGLTEEEAKELNIEYKVGNFPLMANGKALIMNGGQGTIKVLVGKEYDELLGVHILGPRATDLIAECALAIGMEATVEDVIKTIHAHPTVAEAVREAVMASNKQAIHIPNK